MIGARHLLLEQSIEHRDFSVACGGAHNRVDFARRRIAELCAENVLGRDDILKRGKYDFHGRGGKNVKIKLVAVDAVLENLIKQFDLALKANPFSNLMQMFLAHLRLE